MFKTSFIKALVVAVTALNISVHGAPSRQILDKAARSSLEGSARFIDSNLFVCINPNFEEPCTDIPITVNECINIPTPFDDAISSLTPDPGFICTLFVDANCQGASIGVKSPGISDLTGSPFNDNLSSFRCFTL